MSDDNKNESQHESRHESQHGADAGDEAARDMPIQEQADAGYPSSPTPVEDMEPAFDVAGAALGALDPREEAELYTAASIDPAVSSALAAMEAVATELARLAPAQPMNRGRSAGIRSRLVARAAATNVGRRSSASASVEGEQLAARPVRPTRPASSPPSRHQAPPPQHSNAQARHTPLHVIPFEPRARLPMSRIMGGLALAAAVVIVAFGIYSWRNRSAAGGSETASAVRDSSLAAQVAELRVSIAQKDSLISALTGMHTRVIDLMSYADASPMARMFWDQKKQMFIMYASNVKPPTQGKVYQVWLIARGTTVPISVGTFMPDSNGSAVVSTKHPMAPGTLRRVAVTEEPDGGMPAPTGPVMFAGVGR